MEVGEFARQGFVGPRRVMTEDQCRLFLRLWRQEPRAPAPDWAKGRAAASRLLYEVGTLPEVLEPVAAVLGDDVILWGASFVKRVPGQVHHIHTDVETSDPRARAVTVWIGLENTSRESSLRLISRSHLFGATIQQVAAENGKPAEDYTNADILAWAGERDPGSSLVELEMTDGEAIWFDGHLWHGSDNTGTSVRTALILQYASAETPIRVPDYSGSEWPFRFLAAPRPTCMVVRGRSPEGVNRIVPAPIRKGVTNPVLSTWIRPLELPLPQNETRGFALHPIFQGPTSNVRHLSCHVSVLAPGVSPHAPHAHAEEEVLIVLDGEAELVLEDEGTSNPRIESVRPGWLAYYPAQQRHTIRGAGSGPVTYLMLKWNGTPRNVSDQLPSSLHAYEGLEATYDRNGFRLARVFGGRTRYLRRLGCHLTTLEPGAGYEPHADAHDVAILALEGTIETLGARVEAPAIVFYAGGELHGIRNIGDGKARYLVFEFHRDGADSFTDTGTGLLPGITRARRLAGRMLRRVPALRRLIRGVRRRG